MNIVCDNLRMTSNNSTMLLITRLSGVTFEGRQEKLADLRKLGDVMPRKLRHKNYHNEHEGIAVFQSNDQLGWIPKDIAVDLLLPELTASNIHVEGFELLDIVGGTAEKENYGAQVAMFLKGDPDTIDVLSASVNDLSRKATEASVMGTDTKNTSELQESHAEKVKHTSINDEQKLCIIGDSKVHQNDMRKVLLEYGIKENQFKIENDYYSLKNTDTVSSQFKHLFFGATPHSGKGMGEDSSIITHYKKLPNFTVKEIRNKNGYLKLTAEGLRSALEELVVA